MSTLNHKEAALSWSGLTLALLGSIAFSGKAVIVKLAYRHGVDAVTVIALRMAMALPMFLALAWWAGRGQPRLTGRDLLAVAGLGFSGYYLASLLDFLGLMYISASLERLILYLCPTVVLLLSVLWFKRRVSRLQWAAAGLSYLGMLVAFGHELSVQGASVGLGAALVLGSMVSYSVYLLACGEVVQRLGALRLTGWATSFASLLCLLQFGVLKPWSAMWVPEPVLWLSALNAMACTFAPVVMVMMAIERIGSAHTAQVGMVGPLSTIALSIWLLNEPFTPALLAGTVLVLSGVGLLAPRLR